MSLNINKFRSAFKGDGARPTLFEILIRFPSYLGDGFPDSDMKLFAKAATLPSSTIGSIVVPYQGRQIKVAGDRVYDDWNCTIINDESFSIRNAFEFWNNAMDQHTTEAGKKRVSGASANPASYVADVKINQLGKQGKPIKTYTLVNAFPYIVAQIDLSFESNDAIEEFDVTFAYDYFITPEADRKSASGLALLPNETFII